jgi:glycosyltransferase involved in cell wall biosynthesis
MRVLCVIHYPVFGGPHNQVMLLASALARQDVQTTVLLPESPRGERGNAVPRLRQAGIDVVTLPLGRARATLDPRRQLRFFAGVPGDVHAIRSVIRSRGIELVQIGGLVNTQGAIAARLEGVPLVWQLLDTRAPMAIRRLLMPVVVRWSDVVMSTGRAVADFHPGSDRLGDRLRIYFPPVDPDYFRPDAVDHSAARRAFGFSEDDVILGTVGNLNPQKGHEYVLRAMAMVLAGDRAVKLLLVGASHDTHRPYEEGLHRLCRRLGLSVGSDVVFTGGLADVRPALAAMDVFVFAPVQRSEGAPTAVEEAMMMKLPVVATDVGSMREVVDDGRTGFVVAPEDPAALAEDIVRLLDAPHLRDEFALRARERAAARFSTAECARIHLDAYRYAMQRSTPVGEIE